MTDQTLVPCYTAAGFSTHWTVDRRVTLCGRDVSEGAEASRRADCRNCLTKSGERPRNRR